MNDVILKQYAKEIQKSFEHEFYNFVYSILNNLINTNIDKNLKMLLIQYLMNEYSIVFYKNDNNELQISRLSRVITRDENLFPVDISVRTLSGKTYDLLKGEYVIMYNPIPVSYLHIKIDEISKIEKITNYLRNLYKVPVIFQSKDSKVLRSIKQFIKRIFSYDDEDICVISNENSFNSDKDLKKIDLNIPYITDKLLDENESLKEDILEILGVYKNTTGNRERVNEQELIIANSLTTVNKLGIEDCLNEIIKEINEKFGFEYKIELNINKIFDTMKGSDE